MKSKMFLQTNKGTEIPIGIKEMRLSPLSHLFIHIFLFLFFSSLLAWYRCNVEIGIAGKNAQQYRFYFGTIY